MRSISAASRPSGAASLRNSPASAPCTKRAENGTEDCSGAAPGLLLPWIGQCKRRMTADDADRPIFGLSPSDAHLPNRHDTAQPGSRRCTELNRGCRTDSQPRLQGICSWTQNPTDKVFAQACVERPHAVSSEVGLASGRPIDGWVVTIQGSSAKGGQAWRTSH